jgi:hypothetical protein
MFLGLSDPDPLVRGTDPDPSLVFCPIKECLTNLYFQKKF